MWEKSKVFGSIRSLVRDVMDANSNGNIIIMWTILCEFLLCDQIHLTLSSASSSFTSSSSFFVSILFLAV